MSSIFNKKKGNRQVAPVGHFWVYVGPEKRRFVMKIESATHPLFKMLLDDAESEYGFKSEGPLMIPCEVDLFCRVLAEMEDDDDGGQRRTSRYAPPCLTPRTRGSATSGYRLLSK